MKKGGSIFGAYQVFNAENFSSHHAALKSTIARRDTQRRPKASLGFPGLSWGGIPWFCPRFFLTNQPPAVRHPLITSSAETHNLGSASIQGLRLPTASFLTLPSNKATSPYQPIFFAFQRVGLFCSLLCVKSLSRSKSALTCETGFSIPALHQWRPLPSVGEVSTMIAMHDYCIAERAAGRRQSHMGAAH